MPEINQEAAVFLSACLTGNVIYLAYRIILIFRKMLRHSYLLVSVEDMLYWIVVGLFLFSEIYRTCNGNIRWYFVLGTLVGAYLTHFFVQKMKKGIAKFKQRL